MRWYQEYEGYDDNDGDDEGGRERGREWRAIRGGMGVETGPPGAGATITQSALPRWSPFSLSPTGDDGFVVFVVPLAHCASTGPCHRAVASLSLSLRVALSCNSRVIKDLVVLGKMLSCK